MRYALAMALILAVGPVVLAHGAEATFYVATDGDDSNPGTRQMPFATLARAQQAVRARIGTGLDSDLTVAIRGGTYRLEKTLSFGPKDSGTVEHSVTYTSAPGEKVVMSGGRTITGWKAGGDGVYSATVAGVKEGGAFRHLYVNGRRAPRARTPNQDADVPFLTLTSATLSDDLKRYTLGLDPASLADWKNAEDMEIIVAGNWAINRLPIESIDAAKGIVVLKPPHAVGHDAIRPRSGRWCYLENSPDLLDAPGEWYLDRRTGVLSYRPLLGEEMTTAEVIAPFVGRLAEIKGTPESPVRNLHFRGLSFQHSDCRLPDGGYMGIQACHCTQGKSWSRPWSRVPAAIRWDYAEGCSIEDGTLAHLGGCGIELTTCCYDNLIQGNDLFDISGNGIMLGGPKSEEEVPKDNRVSNNHVHGCGIEYFGAIGIWVGFTQRSIISHNLVHDLPYSGISVGWQWNPAPTACKENVIENNHVFDVMNRLCDGGCLYTLGFQPGTVIRGNHFHAAHRGPFAQGAPNNGIFIDQGSKGYLFERNVIYDTAAELVRFNQCAKDWHTWRDNHFGEADEVTQSGKEIIAAAGPEPKYRARFENRKREP
ncbi:MAG: right-handed parallel beta-helix repeat-containing protein [Pirellulaceae bacterium]